MTISQWFTEWRKRRQSRRLRAILLDLPPLVGLDRSYFGPADWDRLTGVAYR
jgi:hypothetical protein